MPSAIAPPYRAKKRRKVPGSALKTRTKLAPFVNAKPIRQGGGLAPLALNKRRANLGTAPTSEPKGYRGNAPKKPGPGYIGRKKRKGNGQRLRLY